MRVRLEKSVVIQLVRKFLPFMENDASLLCSQEHITGAHSQLDESSLQLPTVFPYDPF